MKRYRWDKKYLYWGVTAFLVIAAAILFFLFVSNISALRSGVSRAISILSPFVWGLVIAYLLYPLSRIYQKSLFTPLANAVYKNSDKAGTRVPKLSRGLAVFLAEISLLVIIIAVIWMIVPQLYLSIETIVANSQTYLNTAYRWIDRLFEDYPAIEEAVSTMFGKQSSSLIEWISSLLPEMNRVITNVTSGVYHLGKGIYNILIGMIVSIYVLYSRETFAAYCKKIIYCIFSLEASRKILDGVHFVNDVFLGFISGKLLDSLIIGIICYVCCNILNMPYAMLVSVIVGLTNIIPFFGPFIGGIPSAIIILMADPLKCLIFIIFIILLQQFDGNILGPKILGNSVGINGFWVMFAIILGAGLFGFLGMVLGVPVFVVLFTLVKSMVNRKLKRSDLPTDTALYATMDHIDPETGDCVMQGTVQRKTVRRQSWFSRLRKKREAGGSQPPEETKESGDSGKDGGDAGPSGGQQP